MIDWGPIWLTIRLAFTTVVILFIVGIPLAWWLSQTHSRLKTGIEAITALPLVLPPTVLGFYLLIVMAPNGPLGSLWQAMFGSPLAFTFSGLVIASCLYSLPFVVQPIQSAFESLDRRMIEAAWTLGDKTLKVFYAIILPQCKRGLITALVLGFAHTVGEFGVVLMVGGNIPEQTQVVSISIYEEVEVLNYTAAHTLSALLLVFSFLVLFSVYTLNKHWTVKV